MIKKTITYNDYNNVERTEDFYFNLSKAELTEMELSISGGLVATIQKITAEQDNPKLVALFKDLILRSYGEKSLDGRTFDKSEAIVNKFKHTEAYSELFMSVCEDTAVAVEFVNGIIPETIKPETIKPEEDNSVVITEAPIA